MIFLNYSQNSVYNHLQSKIFFSFEKICEKDPSNYSWTWVSDNLHETKFIEDCNTFYNILCKILLIHFIFCFPESSKLFSFELCIAYSNWVKYILWEKLKHLPSSLPEFCKIWKLLMSILILYQSSYLNMFNEIWFVFFFL